MIIALPMFGDYYTPDLLSGSPNTSMIGNQINLYIRGGQQVPVGAALVVVLMLFLTVLMGWYLVATARAQRIDRGGRVSRFAHLAREPVGAAALARARHARVPRLVDRPDPDRDPLLVQRGPVAQHRAGLVDALVLGDARLGLGRPRPARRAPCRA